MEKIKKEIKYVLQKYRRIDINSCISLCLITSLCCRIDSFPFGVSTDSCPAGVP